MQDNSSKHIEANLNEQNIDTDILTQDGFHYDNHILESMNFRSHKGSPETFNVNDLLQTIMQFYNAKKYVFQYLTKKKIWILQMHDLFQKQDL